MPPWRFGRCRNTLFLFVLVAGRTGAAYAAQIGTMQVNEEIDALRTLGVSPIDYLVLPRMLALMSLALTPFFLYLTYRVGKVRREVSTETQKSLAELTATTEAARVHACSQCE